MKKTERKCYMCNAELIGRVCQGCQEMEGVCSCQFKPQEEDWEKELKRWWYSEERTYEQAVHFIQQQINKALERQRDEMINKINDKLTYAPYQIDEDGIEHWNNNPRDIYWIRDYLDSLKEPEEDK